MSWIIAAVGADSGALPRGALDAFRAIADTYPSAPWKIENGNLRGCRDRLEQLTGHAWANVALSPEDVREEYERVNASGAAGERNGLSLALLTFLQVCATHGLALHGGEGARLMPPSFRA
jgi:hypothetical protein